MKKLVSLLFLLLCALPALSEGSLTDSVDQQRVVPVESGTAYSFSLYEDAPVTISYSFETDEYGFCGECALSVGGARVTLEGEDFEGLVYLAKLDGQETFLLVPEYGASDDPYTFVLSYDTEADALYLIGGVPVFASQIQIHDGIFTGRRAADCLFTWLRPADYVVARGWLFDDDLTELGTYLVEVPRLSYPVGTVVKVKKKTALYKTPGFESKESYSLAKGELAVIVSSDDHSWIYVRKLATGEGGYMQISPSDPGQSLVIDGKRTDASLIFDGLLYAD